MRVPVAVRAAFTMWLVAVGAGIFETVVVVASGRSGGGAVVGVAVRVALFVAAILVATRMRAGHRWARLTLALVLGVVGTLSLVLDPILRLIDGVSLTDMLTDLSVVDATFATSRFVHVAAVLAGCALMFGPSANAYFRDVARRKSGGTATFEAQFTSLASREGSPG